MPHASEYYLQLIGQLQSVRDGFMRDKINVAAAYSSVDPRYDARISAYTKAVNAINSVHLALTFLAKHLVWDEWWKGVTLKQIPDSDKLIYVTEFASFTAIAFVQGMFCVIESSLRLFLRALDPEACNGGNAEFKSVYECLFRSKLSAVPREGIELLDLFRLVRNTIHNNGVYFSPRGGDASVKWEGTTYEFRQGALVRFANLELMIRLTEGLRRLLREVVEDANLRAISTQIDDLPPS